MDGGCLFRRPGPPDDRHHEDVLILPVEDDRVTQHALALEADRLVKSDGAQVGGVDTKRDAREAEWQKQREENKRRQAQNERRSQDSPRVAEQKREVLKPAPRPPSKVPQDVPPPKAQPHPAPKVGPEPPPARETKKPEPKRKEPKKAEPKKEEPRKSERKSDSTSDRGERYRKGK